MSFPLPPDRNIWPTQILQLNCAGVPLQHFYFYAVKDIVQADKYFDMSRSEIIRELVATGRCNIESELKIEVEGNALSLPIRLNISGSPQKPPTAWTVSLKLHMVRIDGIDHAFKYRDKDGAKHVGWHRHFWGNDSESRNDAHIHEPIDDFDDVFMIEEFLIRALKVMRVRLSATDYGTDFLPFPS